MAELFEPTIEQLARLSEDEYQSTTEVTLAALLAIESGLAIPPADDRAEIEDAIIEQEFKLEREVTQATQDLIDGESIKTWEETTAELMTSALLIALLFGFGGVERVRGQREARDVIGLAVDLIRGQSRAIQRTGDTVARNEMTIGRLLDFPRRRALSFRGGYESSRMASDMILRSHNEGIRLLNSAHPCKSCPTYERATPVSINDIVPVATLCECQSNCKCTVETWFNPARAIQELQGGGLVDQVNRINRRRNFLQQTETKYLERNGWL